jgi:hypothetical protein
LTAKCEDDQKKEMTVVEKRNTYKVSVRKVRGNYHFKILVAGNIKMDLEEIGYRLE